MKKQFLSLIAVLIGFSGFTQNYLYGNFTDTFATETENPTGNMVKNGSFDSAVNGVGYHWTKSILTDSANVDGGGQYCHAEWPTCAQSALKQVLNIQNSTPKTYRIEFDIDGYCELWVLIGWGTASYRVLTLDLNNYSDSHYSVTFLQQSTYIYDIGFVAKTSPLNWFRVDNVVMTEVGDNPIQVNANSELEYYSFQNEKLTHRPNKGYWIERKNGKGHVYGR